MRLHLLKIAVGIDSITHLTQVQKARRDERRTQGKTPVNYHFTRNFPRRATQVLDGGSMYWIIRGEIVARQPIIALEEHRRDDGRKYCAIGLSIRITRTQPMAHRAIQGWRYLGPKATPPDLAAAPPPPKGADLLPDGLARELRELGLL